MFTITCPPGWPPIDPQEFLAPGSGQAPYFAHVRFDQGFTYGLVGPAQLMQQTVAVGSRDNFRAWLPHFVETRILPRLEALGRKNALVILGPDEAGTGLKIKQLRPYPWVLPETCIWKPAQAVEFFFFPPIWVHSSAVGPDGNVDFRAMKERVFKTKLSHTGIQIAATRDGQFVFDFSEWAPASLPPFEAADTGDPARKAQQMEAYGLRISVVNAFLTCLRSASWAHRHIVHSPIPITIHNIHDRAGIDSNGGSGSCRAYLGMDDARHPRGYHPDLPHICDWRIADRSALAPIQVEHMEEALQMLDAALLLPTEKALQRIVLYGHACKAFEENNFPLALGQAWLACESLLSEMWDAHQKSQPGGGKRKKPRQISAIIKELVDAGLITADLFATIDPARGARNGWIHDLDPPTMEMANHGLTVWEILMEKVSSLRLQIPHWPSSRGYHS